MSASAEQIRQICFACGMCCDGTLFQRGRILDQEDEAQAVAVGLKIVSEKDRVFFQQPCEHFKGDCAIYDQPRPKVCGRYFCAPIRKLRTGELSLQDAQALLAQAVALNRRLRRSLDDFPEFANKSIPQIHKALDAQQWPPDEQVAMRRKYAPLLLIGIRLFPMIHQILGPRRVK